ncbi:hypothetical protein JPSP47_23900 [Staphylococcus pseudintermedius]
MSILFTMTGVLFALTISYLFSFDRKHIDFKKPAMMLGVQVLLVFFYDAYNDWINAPYDFRTFF